MIRIILLKIRMKISAILKRFAKPISVADTDSFYKEHFNSRIPQADFFVKRQKTAFFFTLDKLPEYKKVIRNHYPDSFQQAVTEADKIINHQFDMLGSGEVYLGNNINWHRDFKSGYTWPKIPYAKINLVNPKDRSDIKIVWELSRLQQFTTLGKAYWYTDNKAYLDEFVATVTDWTENNPVDYGPNWTCSMEVAIRAINLIWGLYLFSGNNNLSDTFVAETVKLLYYHGLHIEQNLETIEKGANTNHLVSNYIGLLYIGFLFPEFDRAEQWRQIAIDGLEEEISLEVFDDGADYECSTSYHRLVTEIFLSAYILADKNGYSFSSLYKNRLEKMIKFSESITPQSGIVPFVGDNDDGFIVKISHEDPASHTHIIEVGNKLFGHPLPIDIHVSEESLFYLGIDAVLDTVDMKKLKSTFFKSSGYGIIRNDRMHLLFSASKIKERHLAGHKHNDNLSFTLEIDSIRYFVDPGTFCYTSDYDERNSNRSVRNHNTVQIDSEEQNNYYNRKIFYMPDDCKSEIDLWVNTTEKIIVSGTHKGYTKLGDNIVHRRTIWTDLKRTIIKIVDEFDGSQNDVHTFETRFITPVTEISKNGPNLKLTADEDNSLSLNFVSHQNPEVRIDDTEYFPRFGKALPAKRITSKVTQKLPCKLVTIIEKENVTVERKRQRIEETLV
ncbi:MAG: hypothetical protein DWP97_11510 [Calditrichaeota bacterium]|nr:MAG: hypothetical protein DWP97_11510 [Calditrichota bacterium]